MGDTKLERFLPKNQHTRRKLLNFENWVKGFLWLFKIEELKASEAQKTEILNYEVLIILKSNNNLSNFVL